MSDVIDQSSFRFQFNITIEDDRSLRKLAGKRLKVHVNREALQVQALIIWGVVMVAGLLAMALEWAAAQILSALLVGFVLGQIYAFFLERFTNLLNRKGFRIWGEYDSRCWLGWRPASDGATNFQRFAQARGIRCCQR